MFSVPCCCLHPSQVSVFVHFKLCFCIVSIFKLKALVYDILPSTTAVFSYAIGSRKLSANVQCFVGAQTVFIAANKVYTNTNKTTIV